MIPVVLHNRPNRLTMYKDERKIMAYVIQWGYHALHEFEGSRGVEKETKAHNYCYQFCRSVINHVLFFFYFLKLLVQVGDL